MSCATLGATFAYLLAMNNQMSSEGWLTLAKKNTSLKYSVGHYKKWNILRNGTHLCSPLVCFYIGHRVGVMPPNSHSSCRMQKLVQEHILIHIDFFHTKNHIGSKSLTHRWKGEIMSRGAICTTFQPKKVALLRPTFKVIQHVNRWYFLKCSSTMEVPGARHNLESTELDEFLELRK